MPELSAGVNCTFEDLAEMDGLVEGNRITCSSPAEKEVPRIVVDQGMNITNTGRTRDMNLVRLRMRLKQVFLIKLAGCSSSSRESRVRARARPTRERETA